MKDLLMKYSIADIFIFIIFLAIAIKEVVTFIDWGATRLRQLFNKEKKKEDQNNEIKHHAEEIETLKLMHKETQDQIQNLSNSVDLLLQSDKDDIKAWITDKYHYFCYELGYIDDYSLDCIERRYSHYKEEGGNSFVENMMEEIRRLPHNITKPMNKD